MGKKKVVPFVELPDAKDNLTIVMGIDPSLNNTALSMGVVRKGMLSFNTEVLKMKNGWSQTEKMCRIQAKFRKILKVLEDNNELPQLAVIEGFSYGSNMNREVLGAVAYILRMLLWRYGVHTLVISPPTLKRYLKSGSLKKDHILKEIYKEYGEDFSSNDEADAFVCMQAGIGIVCMQKGIELDEPDFRLRCASDLLKGKTGDLVLPR